MCILYLKITCPCTSESSWSRYSVTFINYYIPTRQLLHIPLLPHALLAPTNQLMYVQFSLLGRMVAALDIVVDAPLTDPKMFTKTIISTFALLAVANAIKVTSPDDDTVWGTSGSQTISWEAVSTDTESFRVVLDNQVSQV